MNVPIYEGRKTARLGDGSVIMYFAHEDYAVHLSRQCEGLMTSIKAAAQAPPTQTRQSREHRTANLLVEVYVAACDLLGLDEQEFQARDHVLTVILDLLPCVKVGHRAAEARLTNMVLDRCRTEMPKRH